MNDLEWNSYITTVERSHDIGVEIVKRVARYSKAEAVAVAAMVLDLQLTNNAASDKRNELTTKMYESHVKHLYTVCDAYNDLCDDYSKDLVKMLLAIAFFFIAFIIAAIL